MPALQIEESFGSNLLAAKKTFFEFNAMLFSRYDLGKLTINDT